MHVFDVLLAHLARMRARAADLELNYAARDFYYIPIQMTSAKTGVKPRVHLSSCRLLGTASRDEERGRGWDVTLDLTAMASSGCASLARQDSLAQFPFRNRRRRRGSVLSMNEMIASK
jgi:hypothetical protein